MDISWCYCYIPLFLAIPLIFRFLFHPHRNLPPSPFAIPVIGHLHLLRKKPFYRALYDLSLRYGPIMRLQFGVRSVLVVSSPSAVEECFTKNDIVFANRPRTIAGDHLTYNYTALAWTPYGHLWRILRRVCVIEIFSSIILPKYSAVREEETLNLLRRLFKLSSGGSPKVELKFLFSLLSFNVIHKMVAGERRDDGESCEMEEEKKRLRELRERFLPGVSMTISDFIPFLRWVGYKGSDKRMAKVHKNRDKFLQRLIDELREKEGSVSSLESNGGFKRKETKTLLETLVRLQDSEPDFYTDDVIKSIIVIMFIAGTDTSAVTMEWAMSLLLNHPEALQKVRTEIDEHVGCGRLLNDSDIPKLPYLRCVIYETLRLFPPLPVLLPHFSSDDCTIGGYEVPAHTMLLVNAWAVQMDPTEWGEPTKFKPERFTGVTGERVGSRFITFGMGRRACPGAAMGIRVVSLVLGVIIQCFEWERVGEKVDMGIGPGVSMAKGEPLEALCSPRLNLSELLSEL